MDPCFWHDPENQEAAFEARRLGGLNRKKESTLRVVYDVERLETVEEIGRIIEVATLGLLAHENSISRNRALSRRPPWPRSCWKWAEIVRELNEIRNILEPRLIEDRWWVN
jgi:hypothetical protein